MKQFISGLLVGLLLAVLLVAVAAEGNLKLIVNGQDITLGAEPILIDGRTYTPARAVAEALGAKVTFDNTTKTVTVISDEVININDKYITDVEVWETVDQSIVSGLMYDPDELKIYANNKEGDSLFEFPVEINNGAPKILKVEFLEAYNAYLASLEG